MDWLKAHRKGIIAAVSAVLVLFLDADTAKEISGVVGAILTVLVPNDEDAIHRIYH